MNTRRRLKGEHGVAMVEFALVLPLLMLVLVGIFEFGRTFNYWIDATHLANEAARWAVVDKAPNTTGATTADRLQKYVCSQASTDEMQNGLKARVQFNPGGGFADSTVGLDVGEPVRVTVTKTMSFPLIGGMLRILGGTSFGNLTFSGKSTMRLEVLPTTYTFGEVTCT